MHIEGFVYLGQAVSCTPELEALGTQTLKLKALWSLIVLE